MKTRKTVSAKVVAANRRNATKSTGPKSSFGKSHTKLNALKNGFFAKELYLSADEVSDFKTLQEDLTTELAPKTRLQRLSLEHIACCAWRCKLATRLEMQQYRSVAENTDGSTQDVQTTTSRDEAVVRGWYGANRQNLNAGLRFLAILRAAVAENGSVPDYLKEQLISFFGNELYEQLTEYIPVNIDFILLTERNMRHAELYKLPLPELNDNGPKVVPDIRERLNMALKLVDQETRHLVDLEQSYERRSAAIARTGPTMTDFSPRFFTTATRDYHRAIDAFLLLKAQRL